MVTFSSTRLVWKYAFRAKVMDANLEGWDGLRHGGLLLDARRQVEIAALVKSVPLSGRLENELRKHVAIVVSGDKTATEGWVPFVLGEVCGFNGCGSWQRQVPTEIGRRTPLGETAKPQYLWTAPSGGEMAVFIDYRRTQGRGVDRRMASRALYWLRATGRHLAVLTNGRYWRLVFAGLDFDAFCEWDADLWFEGDSMSPQGMLLRRLLHPQVWTPKTEGEVAPLLKAILDSRRGQADLSIVMGEKIRQAVELLIREHTEALRRHCPDVEHSIIYRAAVRVIMRLVVILFAESRDLLPRDVQLYRDCYSVNGLAESLRRAAYTSKSKITNTFGAWPRILALFRLIYDGSHHSDLPLFAYGGDLFAMHEILSARDTEFSRALSVFECGCFDNQYEIMSDRSVHTILDHITRTEIKLKQEGGHVKVSVPVDFSDLSSDYIGILYEGLLDFELQVAPNDSPVVFLGVKSEPALPLSTLEEMDDASIRKLLRDQQSSQGDDLPKEDGDEQEVGEDECIDVGKQSDHDLDNTEDGEIAGITKRAQRWAQRAIRVSKLLRRGQLGEEEERRKVHKIVRRVVRPGDYYLVRWGGTRKGSGTFYTPLDIVAPTVTRVLEPLIRHSASQDSDGYVAPEKILSTKVVDPACGSGAFLIAATRYLTNALYVSVHEHRRVRQENNCSVVRALGIATDDETSGERLTDEVIPCPPDDPNYEARLKGILRRHVVEKCIHGVDIDPIAVGLCKMALWVETMDRQMRFSHLDHKIKCGNSLVGARFDEFQHYPIMAWVNRETGDEKHDNGVHYRKGVMKCRIKEHVRNVLKPRLVGSIDNPLLLSDKEIEKVHAKHDEILRGLYEIHEMPVQKTFEQATAYRRKIVSSDAYKSLKDQLDIWCACWFWPIDKIHCAPLPDNFLRPSDDTLSVSRKLAAKVKFFHWELEFPDVLSGPDAGFDAVVGNPPWNALMPKADEFFSRIDPQYRLYDRQTALARQHAYFSDASMEREWLNYIGEFRSAKNFMSHSYSAFGDPVIAKGSTHKFSVRGRGKTEKFHAVWRTLRARSRGYMSEHNIPFQHQGKSGSDLYKLFLEKFYYLLARQGRLGCVAPAGIHSDSGADGLRKLFMRDGCFEWIFGIINSEKIFPSIHGGKKADIIIVQKGTSGHNTKTAFERSRLDDWKNAETHAVPYPLTMVRKFSPASHAFFEVHSEKDLKVLQQIYDNCVLFGDEASGWGVAHDCEFHTTGDSARRFRNENSVAGGFRADEYSRWLKGKWRSVDELPMDLALSHLPAGSVAPQCRPLPLARRAGIIFSRETDVWIHEDDISEIALPVYEGRMISQFDFSAKCWVSGAGRSTRWDNISWTQKHIHPQYLMRRADYFKALQRKRSAFDLSATVKVGMMSVGNSTNARSMAAAPIVACPCLHSVPVLTSTSLLLNAPLMILLNSFAYDYILRSRLGGYNLSLFILDELPLPPVSLLPVASLWRLVLALAMPDSRFAHVWLKLSDRKTAWKNQWAITSYERTRLTATCNAVAFALFGYNYEFACHVMRGCDLPINRLCSRLEKIMLPSGFWRVDKDKLPELRETVLALVAFQDLLNVVDNCGGNRSKGIEQFLAQNDGMGWILPESLRLSDYGLGHDDRAREYQVVASKFGPRFCDWQLSQDVEDSWKECNLHARNFLGEDTFVRFMAADDGCSGGASSEGGMSPESTEEDNGTLI